MSAQVLVPIRCFLFLLFFKTSRNDLGLTYLNDADYILQNSNLIFAIKSDFSEGVSVAV